MKSKTRKLSIIIIVMMLSIGMTAQKVEGMKVGLKDLKEALKKQSDCSYCSQAYHFINSVKRIQADVKKLASSKPKKKGKTTKKLSKRLEAFAKYAGEEWKGLSVELQMDKPSSEASKNTIKLQLHLESIQGAIEPTELDQIESIRTSLKRIKELYTEITNTLKS